MSNHPDNKACPPTSRELLAYYDFLKENGLIDPGAEADFVEKFRADAGGYYERLANGAIPPHIIVITERVGHAPPEGEDTVQVLLASDVAIVNLLPKAGDVGMPFLNVLQADEAVITTFLPGDEKDAWRMSTTVTSPENKGLLVQAALSLAHCLDDQDPPTQWTVMGQILRKAVERGLESVQQVVKKGKLALGEKTEPDPKPKKGTGLIH